MMETENISLFIEVCVVLWRPLVNKVVKLAVTHYNPLLRDLTSNLTSAQTSQGGDTISWRLSLHSADKPMI